MNQKVEFSQTSIGLQMGALNLGNYYHFIELEIRGLGYKKKEIYWNNLEYGGKTGENSPAQTISCSAIVDSLILVFLTGSYTPLQQVIHSTSVVFKLWG